MPKWLCACAGANRTIAIGIRMNALVYNIGCSLTIAGPLLLSHFCPLSTFCPTSVLFLSQICPISVLCPTFVLFVSSNCQFCPVFDQVLSSSVSILSHFGLLIYLRVNEKRWGQILDKVRTELFFHFVPGYPAPGQKWDKRETLVLSLSSLCPHTLFILQLSLFGQKWDNSRTLVLNVSFLCPHPIHSTIISIFGYNLDNNGTIVGHWS